jgi:MFS family permease
MILGFMVVTSVLVVSFGRLGDMFGRVRMYNMGFVVYTFFSLLLSVTWMSGTAAALYLVIMRIFQGVGAAILIANSSAILTDAFPEHQRGMALGINQIAGISGSFIGLVLGGILAPIQWRLIFVVSVPIGVFGTVWAYAKLKEIPRKAHTKIDWPGNVTFALGLIAIMVGITYGIQPYGGATMGWRVPQCSPHSSAAWSSSSSSHRSNANPPTRCFVFSSFEYGHLAQEAFPVSSRRWAEVA